MIRPIPEDVEVVARLVRAADSVPAPAVARGADLARGRRRLRRQRLVLGAGSAVAVASVVLASALLPGGDRTDGRGPELASQGPRPSRAVDVEPAPEATDRVLPFGQSVATSPDPVRAAAAAFAVVIADRLDPQRTHVDLSSANQQASGGPAGLSALGTGVGWRQPGENGLGVLEVSVGPSVRGPWECDDPAWTCTDATAPDGSPARVARHGGVVEVRVLPPGRAAVTLSADPLWGNNSRVPISSFGLDQDQLLAAASDPRLVLPSGVGLADRDLATFAVFRRLGEQTLIADGETFRSTTGPNSLLNAGRWSDTAGASARLQWDLSTEAVEGTTTCRRAWFDRCLVHTEDGKEIFVGYLRGGGWRVVFPGLHSVLTVELDGSGLPIERAYDLVTDDRLQAGP